MAERGKNRFDRAARGGKTESYLVTYADGTRAVFKPGQQVHWAADAGHEVAAYRLSRLLGIDRVPVTVSRVVNGRSGSLQLFVAGSRTGEQAGIQTDRLLDLFDYLIGNGDRHTKNFLVLHAMKNRRVGIDHGAAFQFDEEVPYVLNAIKPSYEVYQRLKSLDPSVIERELKGLVAEDRVRALLNRREALIERVEAAIASQGEAAYFGLPKRGPASAAAEKCVKLNDLDWSLLRRFTEKDGRNAAVWKLLDKKVRDSVTACSGALKDPRYAGCLDNLARFVSNQKLTREDGHSLQFMMADQEYLARQPKEMISFPKELQDGLPEDWKKLCRDKGWSCVEFVSKSLPNPPLLSYKRLLIAEPGEKFDRWMLFTLPGKGVTKEHLVDFMGVEKRPGEKPLLHFVEYWRDGKGKNPVYRKALASCYKCHPSGMKDIVPAYGSVDAEGLKTVKYVNQWMRSYGPLDWGQGTVDPSAYGPPMGERQTCTNCHNGEFRGVLNAAHVGQRSRHQIFFKMNQDLAMPPSRARNPQYQALFDAFKKAEKLTDEERRELYKPSPVRTVGGLLRLELGGSRGPVAVENDQVLKYLLKRGHLTRQEFDNAIGVLRALEKETERDYAEMQKQYRVDLDAWLKGSRPECAAIF